MEAFENDILKLFDKAIESNPPNSFLNHEVNDLRKHVKNVFQSAKNNHIHAEFELSHRHQNYLNYDKRTMQSNVGSSSNAAKMMQIGSSSHVNVTLLEPEKEMKQCKKTSNAAIRGRLSQNTDSTSYVESIKRFVRSAGPVAKYIAEKRCNEYTRRMQAQSVYRPSPFGSQSSIGPQPTYTENSSPNMVQNIHLTPEMQNSPPNNEIPSVWQPRSNGSKPWKE